ncbi:Uncharacterized alpha/beta hydrolase domain [Aquiflexum balticum DSM 16537]|uniref:Uncharacterized alpha/beta hydrolase domain n=1 Tax=Aquiflexum balticum DSM 16537 TaxID=758820 RepID=A0A1W2H7B1_9BACT|nr:DUF2235 domain-containing protein [Aquiflexum balticum]SMD44810.1 Uncharacterized alpha/beta hydrolase domain [Aquiflexum balticum DSM 16537]
MSRNIVVCCDGTGNKVTVNENSNIVHLFACLEKSSQQLCYYSPGLGTTTPLWVDNERSKEWFKFKAMVSGYSLKNNVLDAYKFIMENYNDEDKIYFFGFSRGAYTVRVVAGIIRMFGILQKGNTAHMEQLYNLYENYINKELKRDIENGLVGRNRISGHVKIVARIKSSFSRGEGKIAFMGLWDTVSSVGNVFFSKSNLPYTYDLKYIKSVRHAVAIDEKRKKFRFQKVNPNTHKDLKEVYFAGVHSDIGGSYPEEGLSKISLVWMLGEASGLGLRLDKKKVDKYVFGIGGKFQPPDHLQQIHNSYKGIFKFFCPQSREISIGSLIHHSVAIKKKIDKSYKPENLKCLSNIEFDKEIVYYQKGNKNE